MQRLNKKIWIFEKNSQTNYFYTVTHNFYPTIRSR